MQISDLTLETRFQLTPVLERFSTVRLVNLSNTLGKVIEGDSIRVLSREERNKRER